jgi:hypothetical protein
MSMHKSTHNSNRSHSQNNTNTIGYLVIYYTTFSNFTIFYNEVQNNILNHKKKIFLMNMNTQTLFNEISDHCKEDPLFQPIYMIVPMVSP